MRRSRPRAFQSAMANQRSAHLRGLLLGAAAQLTDHGLNNRIERVMTAKVERLNRTLQTE